MQLFSFILFISMKKKAIIYDLDNTIYPVTAIGEKLFAPVWTMIAEEHPDKAQIDAIKKAMMVTPFRLVAQRFGLSDEITTKAIALQEATEFTETIATFDDYPETRNIDADRFLVTTGFLKMQLSKIKQMGIEPDFKEIHVVDPTKSSKKEVFADIMQRNGYTAADVLVVGDDPESEIKAAKELGIETVLYYKQGEPEAGVATYAINHFSQLRDIVQ